MNVLIAVAEDGGFQVVNIVDNMAEAQQMAHDYMCAADGICPERFELHIRGEHGYFIKVVPVYDGHFFTEPLN